MYYSYFQAGKIIRIFPDWKGRVIRFIIWGTVLVGTTLSVCNAGPHHFPVTMSVVHVHTLKVNMMQTEIFMNNEKYS